MLFQQAQQRLAASDAEAERLRAKCEEATARRRAFCSGYKWVVRGLLRGGEGGELSDADALDTVQLTQRLDQEVLAQKHLPSCRRAGVCIRHQTSTSVTSLLTPPIPRSHPVIHVRCNSALVQVAINHANQFQIQYLTSASELAHIRTVRNGVLYLVYRRLRARIPFTRKFALLRTHAGFHCSVPSLYALVAAASG